MSISTFISVIQQNNENIEKAKTNLNKNNVIIIQYAMYLNLIETLFT
jgi:hypothetical protein